MDVIVEFSAPLTPLADAASPFGSDLRQRVWDRLLEWQAHLGVPGVPRLVFRGAPRAGGPGFLDVTVLIAGRRCPYDRNLIHRLYEVATGRRVTVRPDTTSTIRTWLRETVTAKDADPALRFLTDLIVEAVAGSAARLIDRDGAVLLLAELGEASPGLRERLAAVDPDLVVAVLRELVHVPVSVADRRTFARWLVHGAEAQWSLTRIAERIVDVARPGVIDVHLHPSALSRMLPEGTTASHGDRFTAADLRPGVGDVLGLLGDGLFYELGIYLLHLRCVADAALPPAGFRFAFNAHLLPPRLGLAEHELLVNETVDGLRRLDVVGVPYLNPANGGQCAIVSASDGPKIEKAGLTTWDPLGFVVLSLAEQVRGRADRLLSVGDVEYALAKLYEVWPKLLEAVGQRVDSVALTRILRHLLRQRIGIRDLRSILSLLLDYRFTTGVRSPTAGWGGLEPYLYVGNRELHEAPYFTEADPYRARFDLSPLQLGAEPPATWLADGRVAAEFVKCGRRSALTHQLARRGNAIIGYLVDAEVELALYRPDPAAAPASSPVLDRADEILRGIADEIDEAEEVGGAVVFVSGPPEVALRFDDLVAGDFPKLTIVHRQMLEPSARVHALASIPGLDWD